VGAWGCDSFGNDDAMDWVIDLEDADDLAPVRDAFAAAPPAGEYLEAPIASVGLAAAEVVAALRGRPAAELPEEVTAWVAAHAAPPDSALLARAREMVARVAESSELRELWDEAKSQDREAWLAGVADLGARLA
jgi:hypothetical protein